LPNKLLTLSSVCLLPSGLEVSFGALLGLPLYKRVELITGRLYVHLSLLYVFSILPIFRTYINPKNFRDIRSLDSLHHRPPAGDLL